MKYVAIALIKSYRVLFAPFTAGACKYHPSCSQYALDAYRRYGFVRGTVLTGWRLLRCNPWSHGGVDYVEHNRLFA